MYMGELVRLVLVQLVKEKLIFNGKSSDRFNTRHEFYTKFVSEIEAEEEGKYSITKDILTEMGIKDISPTDCVIVRYVCELVSRRAAQLVSSALAVLILRIGEPKITIGVDGSVFRYHPKFAENMKNTIKELIPSSYDFQFVLSEDGSGRGAALVAAVASAELQDKK